MLSDPANATLAEVEAAYDANRAYAFYDSADMAGAFIEAGGILLRRYADRLQSRDESIDRDLRTLREEVKDAQIWLDQRQISSNSPRVTCAFTRGRPL